MNAPTDSSVPTKILFIDHIFFRFFLYFFLFIIDHCNHGSLFSLNNEYGYKNEYFLFFLQQFVQNVTKFVFKTTLPRQ